jgi:hypothetical protein
MFLLFGVDNQSDSVQRHVSTVPGSVSQHHLLQLDCRDERQRQSENQPQ